MLIVLFSLIVIYSVTKLISNHNRKTYWFIYIISSTLGFYTMPSFAYFFISVGMLLSMLFIYKKEYMKEELRKFDIFLDKVIRVKKIVE